MRPVPKLACLAAVYMLSQPVWPSTPPAKSKSSGELTVFRDGKGRRAAVSFASCYELPTGGSLCLHACA